MIEHICKNPTCTTLTKNKMFCSVSCANSAQPKRIAKPKENISRMCIECKKNSLPKNAKKFCSKACQARFQHNSSEKIAQWLEGKTSATKPAGKGKCGLAGWARDYLLNEANWQCTLCKWNIPHLLTGKPPLEIDHIDGNRCNNDKANLVVLCPNCHALTLTYRRYNYKNVKKLKEEFTDFR